MADDEAADWEAEHRDASSDSDDEKYRRRRSPSREASNEGKGRSLAADERRGGKGSKPARRPERYSPPWRTSVKGAGKAGFRAIPMPMRGKGALVARPFYPMQLGRLVPVGKGRYPARAPLLSRYGHPITVSGPGVFTMRAAPRLMPMPGSRGLRPIGRMAIRPFDPRRPYLIPTIRPIRRTPIGSQPQGSRPALVAPANRLALMDREGRKPMILPKISGRKADRSSPLVAPPRAAVVNPVPRPVGIWKGATAHSSGASNASRAHPAGLKAPNRVMAVRPKAPLKLLRPKTTSRITRGKERDVSKDDAAGVSENRADRNAKTISNPSGNRSRRSRSRSRSRTRRVCYRSRSRSRNHGHGDARRSAASYAKRSTNENHGRRTDARRSRSRSRSRHRLATEQASLLTSANRQPLGTPSHEATEFCSNRAKPTAKPTELEAKSSCSNRAKATELEEMKPLDRRVEDLVAKAQGSLITNSVGADPIPKESTRPRSRRRSQRSPSKEVRRRSPQPNLHVREQHLREQLMKNKMARDNQKSTRRVQSVSSGSSSSSHSKIRRRRKSRSRRRHKGKKRSRQRK